MNPIVEFIGDARFGQILEEHPRQVGFAFRNAVSNTVFEIQKYARDHFDDNFVERNSFSRRGIVFDKARTPIIHNVEAAVGARKNRPWMRSQEFGFISSGSLSELGKKSGGPQGTENIRVAGSLKRAVRKRNYLQTANIRRRMDVQSKAKTVRGKSKAMLAISFRAGFGLRGSNDFFQFSQGELFSNMEAGLYQFGTGNVSENLGYPGIHMAYRLDNRRKVEATPWLLQAIKAVGTTDDIMRRFEKQLEEQLKRFK